MRRWVKASLAGIAVIVLALAVIGGIGAYFVLRHMERGPGSETDAAQAIEAVKARFRARPALVEIVDPRRGDIRINRPTDVSATRVDTIHIINWKPGELSRTDMPLWLMRFSTVNILSRLGLAPDKFRLTVDDVEHYGPGILVDYGSPGAFRVLAWVE